MKTSTSGLDKPVPHLRFISLNNQETKARCVTLDEDAKSVGASRLLHSPLENIAGGYSVLKMFCVLDEGDVESKFFNPELSLNV